MLFKNYYCLSLYTRNFFFFLLVVDILLSEYICSLNKEDQWMYTCLSTFLSFAVYSVLHWSGLTDSGGQEGQGASEGQSWVCLHQICRCFPEERSTHHLCTAMAVPCASHLIHQGALHYRISCFLTCKTGNFTQGFWQTLVLADKKKKDKALFIYMKYIKSLLRLNITKKVKFDSFF